MAPVGLSVMRSSYWLTAPWEGARLGQGEQLHNEGMQQTKPGLTTLEPVFAADPRCSTDLLQAGEW